MAIRRSSGGQESSIGLAIAVVGIHVWLVLAIYADPAFTHTGKRLAVRDEVASLPIGSIIAAAGTFHRPVRLLSGGHRGGSRRGIQWVGGGSIMPLSHQPRRPTPSTIASSSN